MILSAVESRTNRVVFENILFYVAAAAIGILLKIFYRAADNAQLVLLLHPVVAIVETFYDISFDFVPAKGFYDTTHGIIIGKSCAGLNFYIIVFGMLVFSFVGKLKGVRCKAAAFCVFGIISYMVTILVNASRIIVIIFVSTFADMHFSQIDDQFIHQGIGVLMYFSFLTAIHYCFKKLL